MWVFTIYRSKKWNRNLFSDFTVFYG
jgi:hypothetical protein